MPSAPAFARLYAFALAIDLGLEFVTSTTSTPATGVRVLVSKALFSGSSGFVEVTKASRPNKAPRPTKAPCPTPITGPIHTVSISLEKLNFDDSELWPERRIARVACFRRPFNPALQLGLRYISRTLSPQFQLRKAGKGVLYLGRVPRHFFKLHHHLDGPVRAMGFSAGEGNVYNLEKWEGDEVSYRSIYVFDDY
ncbi:hypothetical protein DFP72DRAFT_854565 [Ephemerocybe angulata]|uniref:Uncharacterized protein n=1 Tax=Ephemerocybe angulata TaxID=980116 RepID=A0A8H6LZY4_9AGAR|nr:hypothetical protein DFP72DRAFT_854565 [Tulosesus angulatus]